MANEHQAPEGTLPVRVVGVCKAPHGGAFVLLRVEDGRNVPIWIDENQAVAIHMTLEGMPSARPMTHEFIQTMLTTLGAVVTELCIDRVENNVFHATCLLQRGEENWKIDCRPSDGISLALRFQAPIFIAESVVEAAHVEAPKA